MTKTLQFSQPKALQHAFTIDEGDTETGSLTYKDFNHRHAIATINGQQWTFVQKGFLRTKIYVYQDVVEEPTAIYDKSFIQSKGTIALQDKTYSLQKKGFLHSRYVWTSKQDVELITYAFGGVFKTKGDIDVLDTNVPWELLAPLGLFIGLNIQEDDASAAASGASA